MNILSVLYGGDLSVQAFENIFDGKNVLYYAVKNAGMHHDVSKIVLFVDDSFDEHLIPENEKCIELIKETSWNTATFFSLLSKLSYGFDLVYFSWADCPFIDQKLTESIIERHKQYAAEYSYADGWNYGLSPEILAPETTGILAKINGAAEEKIKRDTIWVTLQKDINAFDIETVIAEEDTRNYRLSFCADSKRNLLLLKRFWQAGITSVDDTQKIIKEKPSLLRTLPAFYPIQVAASCPQSCIICPYTNVKLLEDNCDKFLTPSQFDILLNKIIDFSGDAVIDLSLWGELALHPQKMEIINSVLEKPALSLIIETSAIGWKTEEIEILAKSAETAAPRLNKMSPLSIIISLDSIDPKNYAGIRGNGFDEALSFAKMFVKYFKHNAYIQAVRCKGKEDDIEKFYRFWKMEEAEIIIQKYDHFCRLLPDLTAADLSPVQRLPCWHIIRDFPIKIDGTVVPCREMSLPGTDTDKYKLGNAFNENLDIIWKRGEQLYESHCRNNYNCAPYSLCADCDEYWTFNF